MSIFRWVLLLAVAGVMGGLSVYAQKAASNLSYRKTELQAEVRRLEEERASLEARIEAILTPEALAAQAARFTHLVPPGRSE
ncbi:MAG TPA: hypothetical protein ENN09_01315 [Planctomycetes bacterium]|nr:hypothetical protein [Planctomycetota bacterium]